MSDSKIYDMTFAEYALALADDFGSWREQSEDGETVRVTLVLVDLLANTLRAKAEAAREMLDEAARYTKGDVILPKPPNGYEWRLVEAASPMPKPIVWDWMVEKGVVKEE